MPVSKSLHQVLKEADPALTIVPGGVRQRPRVQDSDEQWAKAAGVICTNCGREVFRSRDGLCLPCWEKENEFEVRDSSGMLELLPRSVIMEIARKPAQK